MSSTSATGSARLLRRERRALVACRITAAASGAIAVAIAVLGVWSPGR